MATQSDGPSGPNLAEGIRATELREGGMISGHVGDEPVLLTRVGQEVFAIGGKCTHYGGPLAEGVITGDTVRCPWHHACFSLRTGEALRAPAFDPVARWRVETPGDRIVVREKMSTIAKDPIAGTASNSTRGRFVIVGGGAAGFAAAERLRREGFAGDVVIVSADAHPPVDPPNLSKDYLAGKAPEDWVFIKPAGFYEDLGIVWNWPLRQPGWIPARESWSSRTGGHSPLTSCCWPRAPSQSV